eukprot:11688313-Karenia_brevis.AAC.1
MVTCDKTLQGSSPGTGYQAPEKVIDASDRSACKTCNARKNCQDFWCPALYHAHEVITLADQETLQGFHLDLGVI